MIWSHSQLPVLFLLTVQSFSILAAKNIINLILVDHLVTFMCRVFSCVVGRGYFLWPVCSLGKTLVSLCPASFCTPRPNLPVTPGISWLPTFAFQSPAFLGVSSKRSVGFHRTVQLQLLQHYWLGQRLRLLWYWMFCFGIEQRSICSFWDCTQVLHFRLFCWPWGLFYFFWGILAHSSRYNGHLREFRLFLLRSSDPTRDWPRLSRECPGVSSGGVGQGLLAAGSGALHAAMHAWGLWEEVTIIVITSTVAVTQNKWQNWHFSWGCSYRDHNLDDDAALLPICNKYPDPMYWIWGIFQAGILE